MITVEKLNFDYPDKRALFDVSFTIARGSVTALVGPNGAGKTTLLRCLAALERYHSGKITIGGYDVADHPREVHHLTGYLSDFFGLYDALTLRQCLTYMAWCQKIPALDVKKRVIDLAMETGIDKRLDERAGTLSRGYRQRLGIALALIHDPKLIILDEPASGMDPEARIHLSQMMRRLRQAGKTMIVSSHILNELEDYCTDMLVIHNGRVAEHVKLQDYAAKAVRTLHIGITHIGVGHLDTLQKQPGLTVKSTENDIATCDYTGTVEEQQKMLQALIAAGVPVFSFSASSHKLADAYMDVTSRKEGKP
ncbi:MAG: ABC transporter ATP-binding protein [Alphaproteobacteria bacterium]